MSLEWRGAVVESPTGPDGTGPPTPDRWEPVTLPGRPSTLAGAEHAAYRTTFPDPRDADVERGLVTVRGVWATATVWCNGQHVASGDWAGPIRAPFEPMAENDLVVVCSAPTDRFRGREASGAVPARVRTPSIRGGVDVEAVPGTYVHGLAVRGVADDEESHIEVAATVDSLGGVEDDLTLSLRPEGFRGGGSMERTSVSAGPGERVRVEASVPVRNERRWWPRELGRQYRYTVRAKLGAHERSATTGLVAVDREGGDLLLNGHRHRPRGVVVPPGADPDAVVEHALDANASLLRARSHVPTARLARACDDAGLLLWQDLPLTGPGPIDLERGRTLARALARSRAHHPSIVYWGVHDDPVDVGGPVTGSGTLEKLRYRWRAWRADADHPQAEALAGSLPSDAAVLPVTGPPGSGADALHCYPGWRDLGETDVAWLLEQYPTLGEIVGATGAGSLARPTDDAVAGLDRDLLADAVAAGPTAAPAVDALAPDSTQRAQARIVRTVLDALRREGVGTIVLDSLLDADVAGGMGVLTAEGERKPAFAAVASTFRPLQAVLDGPPTGDAVDVTVCNDTQSPRTGTVAWTAGDASGSTPVEVGSFARADGGTVDVPADAQRLTLEFRAEDVTATNSYDLSLWR